MLKIDAIVANALSNFGAVLGKAFSGIIDKTLFDEKNKFHIHPVKASLKADDKDSQDFKLKQAGGTYASDRVIVKFKNAQTRSSAQKVLKKFSEGTSEGLDDNTELVLITNDAKVEDVIKELIADPDVEYAEPDYKLYPANVSGDLLSGELWGLENTGQSILGTPGTPGVDINIKKAWDITKGSSEVTVAIIDTGMDINHPDLQGRVLVNIRETAGNEIDDDKNGYVDDIKGWDFANNDNTVFDIADEDSHGTHVAGIIAAENNAIGVVGVAPNIRILPLKFLAPSGGYASQAIKAIEYAKKNGAKIINASWSGGAYSQALRDAIQNCGALFVAAAGNEKRDIDIAPIYPASFDCPNVLSVAGVNNTGARYSYSNTGVKSVDLGAPAARILSTVPRETETYDTAYSYRSGTSMAAPHVSGVAALVLSLYDEDPIALKTRIMRSAKPLDSLKGVTVTGGMVDAYAALAYTPNNDIPGIPLQASNTQVLDSEAYRDDVYSVELETGDIIALNLTGAEGADFDLYLYSPGTKSVATSEGVAALSENAGGDESILYLVQQAGRYYVNVHAHSGYGTYTLDYEKILSAGNNIIDDKNRGLVYTGVWDEVEALEHENGTARVLASPGTVTAVFKGSVIKWTGFKDSDQGVAEVLIDDILQGEIDLFSETPQFKQVLFQAAVTEGAHRITIRWTGKAGSGARKSACAINLDTFVVEMEAPPSKTARYEETAATFTGEWWTNKEQKYSGGMGKYSSNKGDFVKFQFTGHGIKWLSATNSMRGIAKVTLDNSTPEYIDTYSPVQQFQSPVYDKQGLPHGQHTIKIEVTGNKNTRSTSPKIFIDTFDVTTYYS